MLFGIDVYCVLFVCIMLVRMLFVDMKVGNVLLFIVLVCCVVCV